MIPAPRLLVGGLALAALSLAPTLDARALVPWLAATAVFVGVALVDLYRVRRVRVACERSVPRVVAHRRWMDVRLRLRHDGARAIGTDVHDLHPARCTVEGQPARVVLPPGEEATVSYRLRPEHRGELRFAGTDVRLDSPLRLWQRKVRIALPDAVKVYPDFRAERSRDALLGARAGQADGALRLARSGGDGEFHQLREYRDGDSLRQIDWKASTRAGKPISRDYQEERDQQLVFLLDCSVRMRHGDPGGTHMDHAMNAVVRLAQIALRQGDAIGLMSFGGPDRWLPPAKGTLALQRLLDGVHDLEPTTRLPDYAHAVQSAPRPPHHAPHPRRARHQPAPRGRRRRAPSPSRRSPERHPRAARRPSRDGRRRARRDDDPEDIASALTWLSAEGYRQDPAPPTRARDRCRPPACSTSPPPALSGGGAGDALPRDQAAGGVVAGRCADGGSRSARGFSRLGDVRTANANADTTRRDWIGSGRVGSATFGSGRCPPRASDRLRCRAVQSNAA